MSRETAKGATVPTYQYACTDCGHRFDQVQSFTDAALPECPECSGRLRKLFGSVGVVFKGSGFYRTDSRAESKKGAEKSGAKSTSSAEKSSSGENGSSSSSTKSDSTGSSASSPSTSNSSSSSSSSVGASAKGS